MDEEENSFRRFMGDAEFVRKTLIVLGLVLLALLLWKLAEVLLLAFGTVLAVVVIQQIEGNVIFPLVARSVVSIPPALALFAILTGSVLFGTLGLVFGFPLAVVAYVLVKKLYVREALGEATPIPGEAEAKEDGA